MYDLSQEIVDAILMSVRAIELGGMTGDRQHGREGVDGVKRVEKVGDCGKIKGWPPPVFSLLGNLC
jgi:hypothetical protein